MLETNWFAVLRRQGFVLMLVLAAGLLLTVLVILLAPRRYQSEARLLVRLGRENASLDPTASLAGETMSFQQTRDTDVHTLLEAMHSRTVLQRVIDDVGATAVLNGTLDEKSGGGGLLWSLKSTVGAWVANFDPMDDCERAIIELQKNLSIDAGSASTIINVHYKTKTPELAQRVTQAWVDVYLNEHARMYSARGSLEFFEDQEAQLERSLQVARSRLRETKSQYGIVTIAGKQTNLESQLRWAHGVVVQSQSALAASKAKLNAFTELLDKTRETIVTSEIKTDNNDAQNQMKNRLYELEIEERRFASIYTTDHPAYRIVRKQLDEARRVLDTQKDHSGEVTQGINPLHTVIMQQWSTALTDVAEHEAAMVSATEILAQLQHQLVSLNEHEAEIAVVQREVDVLESQYRSQYQKREQARLAADMENSRLSNLNVIQPASLQHRPVSPNKKICGLLGIVGSFFIAVGIAFLRESQFAQGVHSDRIPSNAAAKKDWSAVASPDHDEIHDDISVAHSAHL